MGKHGPCYHCGVTSTPLWRNGPPEKPVLCNACGSRWRTKGTLVNYTPLHARAEPEDFDDYRVSKAKSLSIKNKEEKFLKRKYDSNITEFSGVPPEYNHGFRKVLDEDTSNRSSSGSAISNSAISNSESCAQYGSADASDLTGPSQPVVWDTMVPSRKRTCVTRSKPSSVEKLTRDLFTILHEQQSSCFSASSEEDLLLECDKPMVSVEIGHGSVLIRHPSSIIAREEESEASSLSFDNKQHITKSNSKVAVFPGLFEDRGRVIEKIKKPPNPGTEHERIRRGKDQPEKLQIMTHHNSPLCFIDLQEILNFDTFANHLTNDEQQQLLKFLPSIDTSEAPDRKSFPVSHIRSMLESPEFKESLLSFQKLLADGLFDNSFTGLNAEDHNVLKKLVLCNLTKSKWVEQYKIFKDSKGNINESSESALATDSSHSLKRPREELHHKFSGSKAIIMKSPKRMMLAMSNNDEEEELVNKDSSFFTSRNSIDEESSHLGYEQDLLLDIPSNGLFPQAELLIPSSSFDAQASTSSSSVYPYYVRRI